VAKTLCKIAGFLFLIVGLAGFAAPTLAGFHLTPIHNIVHILTGAIALYMGFSASYEAARTFCLIFGVVYLLLGILGFVSPDVVAGIIGHPTPVEAGALTPDNAFHLLAGIVFLAVGAMRPAVVTTAR
jgi:uncharacterized membrane protein HdeD (DUF308 family)